METTKKYKKCCLETTKYKHKCCVKTTIMTKIFPQINQGAFVSLPDLNRTIL